jgi:O-antigen/teichoic acid export membrane protein
MTAMPIRYWLKESVPFLLLGGVGLITSKLTIVIAGFYLPSAQVGFYKISVTAGTIVAFLLAAVNGTIAPMITHMSRTGRMRQLQQELTLTARLGFAVSVCIAVVYLVFGTLIIRFLYGDDFLGAYHPLLILTVGQVINAAAGSVGTVLSMTGFQRETLRGHAVAAAVSVLGSVVLIPILGIFGAAIASAAGMVTWNIVLLVSLREKSTLRTSILGVRRRQSA